MKLRHATLEDLPEMKQLYADTICSVCRKDYTEEQTKVWASSALNEERWLDMLVNQVVLIAESDGIVVGFASLKDYDYIDFFYVHKDFQGHGIAGKLLKRLTHEAINNGTKLLTSDISVTARPFFEKNEFKVVAEQENIRQNQVLINYKMMRHLPGPQMNPGLKAVFNIDATFNITGRGLIFAGIIMEGNIDAGDVIEFRSGDQLRRRTIRGLDMIRSVERRPLRGMLIRCINNEELEELRIWKPFNVVASIYPAEINHG